MTEKTRSLHTIDIMEAKRILGLRKVVTADHSSEAWGNRPPADTAIPFSRETLFDCFFQNDLGRADWRLIYLYGLSWTKQTGIKGSAISGSVERRAPSSGYKLINFHLLFGNMDWQSQEKEIGNLRARCKRTCEIEFSEAIQTIHAITGEVHSRDGLRHWGNLGNSKDSRFVVGLDASGLLIEERNQNKQSMDVLVSTCRRPDFPTS